jgi:DNA-binding transcriptional MerR regulator
MSSQPARGYFSISEVLAQLRADFPDISVSKIRFLETEGLIAPARSPAGYRRFGAADVDRLRHILIAQRDQYLPLRVIRERLDEVPQPVPPEQAPAGSPGRLLTRRELVESAGLSDALLTELESFGLLRKVGRQYGPDAAEVARTAAALAAYGVEARHLRAVRAAAEREASMIESVVAPIQRQRGPGARELAGRTAAEIAGLVLRLHDALVDGALAEAGLAVPEPQEADPGDPGRQAASAPAAEEPVGRARGVGGARA